MPTKAQEVASNPLCEELSKIGRLLHPLDPASLLGRIAILDSPAVRAVARPEATEATKADHAVNAIRSAVTRVTPTRNNRIAQAMFGIGEFDGKTVSARKALLEAAPYLISRDEYAKQRPYALEAVAFHLEYTVSGLLSQSDVMVGERTAWHVSVLTSFASRIARIMFTSLGLLSAKEDLLKNDMGDVVALRCGEDLLYDLLNLLDDIFYRCNKFHPVTAPEQHLLTSRYAALLESERMNSHLPKDAAQAIVKDLAVLLTIFPIEQDELSLLISRAAYGVTEMERVRLIPHAIFAKWVTWNYESNPVNAYAKGQTRKPFEEIVDICNRIETTLSRNVEFSGPSIGLARLKTYKRLASHYNIEEWAPIRADGTSARVLIEQYFDRTLTRLAFNG